jgi:predicted ATPase
MTFEFKNLGAIKEAQIEMGRLTVISGKNNTGKTYLTNTVYMFLKNWTDFFDEYEFENLQIEKTIKNLSAKNNEVKISTEDIEKEILHFSDIVSKKYEEQGLSFKFDFRFNAKNNFTKKLNYYYPPLKISKEQNSNELVVKIIKNENNISKNHLDNVGLVIVTVVLVALLSYTLNSTNKLENVDNFQGKFTKNMIKIIAQNIFQKEYFSNTFLVSAERTSTYFFSKEIFMLRNEAIKNKKMKLLENVSNLPLSIEEQISFINELPKLEKDKSFLYKNNPEIIEYIEKEILKVSYVVDNEEPKILIDGKAISYYQTSTSIRALSDLNFWLKHKVQEGNLLMIDEPELNLHPENQIKIARLLVKLVNAGIRVWITTHSDYIVKELNNCLMLSNDFLDKEVFMQEYGYKENDILKKDDIRVYIAHEEGTVEQVEIGKFGMKKSTFDEAIKRFNEVSDTLFNILD